MGFKPCKRKNVFYYSDLEMSVSEVLSYPSPAYIILVSCLLYVSN